jgi:hypothetical protein
MIHKPVIILPGMDHSDFCPGFQVPGDVFPSDITNKDDSNALIGKYSSAFIHFHSDQDDEKKDQALVDLRDQSEWTRIKLLKPMIDAISLEGSVDGEKAPWCEKI